MEGNPKPVAQAAPEHSVVEMEAESGGGDDVQPVSGMGEAGEQGKCLQAAGGSRVKELLEAGLVDDITMHFCRRGTSMSSRHFQSGQAASMARRETVVMCGGGSGGLARICSTRDFVTEVEARKAAGEWRSALRRLRPL